MIYLVNAYAPFDRPSADTGSWTTGPAVGERIPEFAGKDQNGIRKTFDDIKGLGVVAISYDSAEILQSFSERQDGIRYTMLAATLDYQTCDDELCYLPGVPSGRGVGQVQKSTRSNPFR